MGERSRITTVGESRSQPEDVSAARLLEQIGLTEFDYYSAAPERAMEHALASWPLLRAVVQRGSASAAVHSFHRHSPTPPEPPPQPPPQPTKVRARIVDGARPGLERLLR